MNIGEQIRNYRKKAGISQKELGERLEVSQQHIAQYENGKRIPKVETLEKIARALQVDVWELQGYVPMDTPWQVSPEHPVAFPGLEKKVSEIGYSIQYGCDYTEYDDNVYWINYPDGEQVFLTLEELTNLNTETDTYLKFRLEELRKKKR